MIISQTPYRVSFAGVSSNLPAFYHREYGAVLSATIDQHIYVTIHRQFEPTICVSYSRTEIAHTLGDVQHELVREAMRLVEIDEPLAMSPRGPEWAPVAASPSACSPRFTPTGTMWSVPDS